jgi:hypothetical protein
MVSTQKLERSKNFCVDWVMGFLDKLYQVMGLGKILPLIKALHENTPITYYLSPIMR